MKHLLLTTIAAVVLVGCGEVKESLPQVESKAEPASIYSLVNSWPKLPKGVELGQVTGVAVDSHNHVFVFHRSDRTWIQPFPKEKIKGHTIAMFKGETGELIKTFGEDKFIIPHGLSVDPEDNVWVTDVGSQQIHKLSPEDGAVLLSIGEAGVQGDDQNHFALPSDVSFSKDGGVYVSDGYTNTRVVKFSPTGQYEFQWGTPGARPGYFNLPHGVDVDDSRVYVADRSNLRLQIFDHKGTYLSEWKGEKIGRPFGVATNDKGEVFVIDGGDQPDNTRSRVIIFDQDGGITDTFNAAIDTDEKNLGHDIAVGPDSAVYVADAWANSIRKYMKSTE